jgi:hypothetical protein
MDITVRRRCADPAENQPGDPESIAGAEYRSDIVQRPYIIQNNDYGILCRLFVAVYIQPPQFFIGKFSHDWIFMQK